MSKLYGSNKHHFEAEITILPLGPNTRNTHPFNGIRWAFSYTDDWDSGNLTVSDVWPEFIDENKNSIPCDIPLSGILNARMYIVCLEMVPIHMKRLLVGTKFYCTEGTRVCATGIVTKLEDIKLSE